MASSFFAGMEAVASSQVSGSSFEPRASRCRSTRMGKGGLCLCTEIFFVSVIDHRRGGEVQGGQVTGEAVLSFLW